MSASHKKKSTGVKTRQKKLTNLRKPSKKSSIGSKRKKQKKFLPPVSDIQPPPIPWSNVASDVIGLVGFGLQIAALFVGAKVQKR